MSSNNDPLIFRSATRADVRTIVCMLADDQLGAQRESVEDPLPQGYYDGFERVDGSPDNELIVVERAGEIVAVLQLTFIPYLTYQGGVRALIEGVRVSSQHRGAGIGGALFEWAIARARERGCNMVQLTTNKQRKDARRFYEALGFVASHDGMKLHLR